MTERPFILVNQQVRDNLHKVIDTLPVDGTLECVIREHTKKRTNGQNAGHWGYKVQDITEQAWFGHPPRQFDKDTWHIYFKEKFMPESDDTELSRKIKDYEKYRKWSPQPDGTLRCIASTTQLTKYGMYVFDQEIEAFGAELGVLFREGRK